MDAGIQDISTSISIKFTKRRMLLSAIYYCTIISRDALKLPIPRESFFHPKGRSPEGWRKWLPSGNQCIYKDIHFTEFLARCDLSSMKCSVFWIVYKVLVCEFETVISRYLDSRDTYYSLYTVTLVLVLANGSQEFYYCICINKSNSFP